MTTDPASLKLFCKSCKGNKKESKARALCYECHIRLCEECSKKHLGIKGKHNHHLIDLIPIVSKHKPLHHPPSPSSITEIEDEDDLFASDFIDESTDFDDYMYSSDFIEESYDFLDDISLNGDTILYLGAQVALEPEQAEEVDPRRLKAKKCLEFSVKRPQDRKIVWLKGVVCLSSTVVVADINNNVLKLFRRNGKYLASTKLKDSITGITLVRGNTFATFGSHNKVYMWRVRGPTIFKRRWQIINAKKMSFPVGWNAYGICSNGSYYCLLHYSGNVVTILDSKGKQERKITMKEACEENINLGCDVHMDNGTNNIYVPCWHENGLLCMTIEGETLWFCQLYGIPRGITEIEGTLCLADSEKVCLHLITKEGEYVQHLMTRKELGGRPAYVCYGQDYKLYVSYDYSDDKCDRISVYTIEIQDVVK